jgi:hypothetical protein
VPALVLALLVGGPGPGARAQSATPAVPPPPRVASCRELTQRYAAVLRAGSRVRCQADSDCALYYSAIMPDLAGALPRRMARDLEQLRRQLSRQDCRPLGYACGPANHFEPACITDRCEARVVPPAASLPSASP